MPEINLAIAIIIAAGTLVLGFLAAFLIENGKISVLKNENKNLKSEKEKKQLKKDVCHLYGRITGKILTGEVIRREYEMQ